MEQRKATDILWPFWIQIVLLAFLPFIVWGANTPSNILHSSAWRKLLNAVSLIGGAATFFACIPLGIIGLRFRRRMGRLCIATTVLSIVNVVRGAIQWGSLVFILVGLLLGPVSS